MDKPTMVILTSPKLKNNMSISQYRYLKRPEGKFNVKLVIEPSVKENSLKYVVDNFCNGTPPEYILLGTMGNIVTFTSPENNKYVKDNDIRTIFHVVDVESMLDLPHIMDSMARWQFDYMWAAWDDHPKIKPSWRLREFISDWEQLANTKLVFCPWSYNPRDMNDPGYNRPYDMMYAMSINPYFPYHKRRREMWSTYCEIANKDKGIMPVSGSLDDKGVWHGVHGDMYYESIKQSRTFMVDTTMRRYMTAKYLEGGACGATLIGDAPIAYPDVFNKDTMYVIDYDAPDFGLVMKEYVYDAWHRKEYNTDKATRLKEALKVFEHKLIIPELEAKIL